MAFGIFQDYKIEQNRKRLHNTTGTSSESSTPSYSYNKLNEYTAIIRKKIFTADTNYRKNFVLNDKTHVIIKNKPASKPYSKDMLI